jgi:hypothetical protein
VGRTKMAKLEKEVKEDIKEMLEELGAWQYMPVPNGYGMKGVPDHIACVPLKIREDMVGQTMGVFVGIEAKQLKKDPSVHQELQLSRIRKAKGMAFVIRGTKDEDGSFSMIKKTLFSVFGRL